MTTRHLFVGLDGADPDLVRALGPRRLPILHGLMDAGVWARLRSVRPPATLPNWATLLTGVDPGVHGVFDFTTRTGSRVRFTAGTVRAAPTVCARLDRLGLSCACVGFPGTWPPERLDHGVFISGWDAPVAFEADRSYVWPPALHSEMTRLFGPTRFDDVDEFRADDFDWHRRLPAALCRRVERGADLGEWLLRTRTWNLFAIYFGESDTAAHHLWGLHDADSPRHPGAVDRAVADGLGRVYESIDHALARLIRASGGDEVEITISSDHGSGGSSDKILYLNRVLAEAGLLTFRRDRGVARAMQVAKELALTRLPPAPRERLFRAAGAMLPGWVESQTRFGAIDMTRTRAFSEELNYFPSVWINLRDREPHGTVEASDVQALTREVESTLLALRDPWTGQPIVESVLPRADVYAGPLTDRAPDLIVTLHLDRGYSYGLLPSGTAPRGTGPFRRLHPEEYLGRKGRSLPGSHRDRGLFVAAGPLVAQAGEIDAAVADVPATLLARMGVAIPPELAGRVLWEALRKVVGDPRPLPEAQVRPADRAAEEGLVEARLRALGYVD